MTMTPQPSGAIPDRSIYERRESGVRSSARSMPRQFDKATDVLMHDNRGGRYPEFLSGCSTLTYGHHHPVLNQAPPDHIAADGIAHGLALHPAAKAAFLQTHEGFHRNPRGLDNPVRREKASLE